MVREVRYKPSIYNYTYKNILWNGYSNSVGVYSEDEIKAISEDPNGLPQELKQEVIDCGFIVPDDLEEYQRVLCAKEEIMVRGYDTPIIDISPTTACNARCSYCFQKGCKYESMTDDTVEQTIRFVESVLEGENSVLIEWFGGEPMLMWDTIVHMSRELIAFCDANGKSYDAMMTTNGSMLRPHLDELKDLRITTLRLPIDGPGKVYEERKAYVSNGCTYDELIDTAVEALKRGIEVFFRLNADKDNSEDIKKVSDRLSEIDSSYNYHIDVTPITGKKNGHRLLTTPELSEIQQYHVHRKGERTEPELLEHPLCPALSKKNIAIGPDGLVFKCVKCMGAKGQEIGDVWDGFYYNSAYYFWKSCTPPDMCRECEAFPVCLGGCPYDQKYIMEWDSDDCDEMKGWIAVKSKELYEYYCTKE